MTERVLIVGAGPVGLTLAIALARAGTPVRVIDAEPSTKHQPRAAVLWPRTLEIMAALGCADALVAAGREVDEVEIGAEGRTLGVLPLGAVPGPHPRPVVLEQYDTERLLCEHLAGMGVEVERSTQAVGVRQRPRGVEVDVVRDDRRDTLRTHWVVGCDGAYGAVRPAMNVEMPGRAHPNLQVVQANAHPEGLEGHLGGFFLARDAAVGAFPTPHGHWRFFAFKPDPDVEDDSDPDLEEVRDAVARAMGIPDLKLTLAEPRWLKRARFQDRVADHLVRGRAILCGDSAHVWAPLGGRGMNAGVYGAWNLAWKLSAVARGQAAPALLQTYSDEQRRVAKGFIADLRVNVIEKPPGRVQLATLKRTLPPILASERFRRWVEVKMSDTGLRHDRSRLTVSTSSSERFKPGAVVRAEGAGDGLHWTVLASNPAAAADAVRASGLPVRAGTDGADARRLVLVRPDGHAGLVAADDDLGAVRRYLRRIIGRSPETVPTGVVPRSKA